MDGLQGAPFRWSAGDSKVLQFEKAYAAHIGVKYALGVTSGTTALFTAEDFHGETTLRFSSNAILPFHAEPITVTAIGVRISEPSPSPSAIGVRPSTVVRVVIMMGRRRRRPASMTASTAGKPP